MKKEIAERYTRITRSLDRSKRDSQELDAYPYLPGIIKTLEQMQQALQQRKADLETCRRLVRGLGRLVTEDYAFSESSLGQELLKIVDDFTFDKT